MAPYSDEIRGSYYYLDDDFQAWRSQFEALVERHQWMDAVAKQFAFAYMRDMATQTVVDIPLYGPETLGQMLNTYQDWFGLIEDLVRLCMGRGGTLRGPRRRRPTQGGEGASSNRDRNVGFLHQAASYHTPEVLAKWCASQHGKDNSRRSPCPFDDRERRKMGYRRKKKVLPC